MPQRHHENVEAVMDVTETTYRNQDLLVLKKTICDELARVKEVVSRLQSRRQHLVAPDLSKDDILEIFYEEHDRLSRQLQAIDESLVKAEEPTAPNLVEQHRQIERWRSTLAAVPAEPVRH
jgi:hypothetical protein